MTFLKNRIERFENILQGEKSQQKAKKIYNTRFNLSSLKVAAVFMQPLFSIQLLNYDRNSLYSVLGPYLDTIYSLRPVTNIYRSFYVFND